MKFKLSTPFRFAPVQVTALALVLYAAVFISVLFFDELPSVPKDTHGLDLERAYEALSTITTRPRPYISHANDDVHAYILSRLRPLASRYEYVHLSDDMSSNVTYVESDRAIYFEGTNVLLKIDGTDSSTTTSEDAPDGVLFSCHYDSVSTAPGATDDGMGVATLLELAEYLAMPERRPCRTAVIFFNNGEEDYLNGAHALYEHPWSNLTSAFINLEGAASGGRPVIFRSTSYGAASSLVSSAVKHPHGNTLTSDAFSAGMIRSATDYQVYARGVKGEIEGMQGLDFAFYKNRAYYHTPRDSIAGMGTGEGRKALWAMMETTLGSGLSMLNRDESNNDARASVYFDLFGHALILLPMNAVYGFNIALLVIGPLSTIGLLAWVMLVAKEYSEGETIRYPGWKAKSRLALKTVAGWISFWVAIVVGVLVHTGLISGFVKLNPYIVHSRAYTVLTIFLAVSFLALVLPLQALHHFLPPTFVSQKLAVSLSLFSFTWLLLFASTLGISLRQLGSLYWTTVFNFCTWAACVIELAHAIRRRDPGNELGRRSELFTSPAYAEDDVAARRLVRGVLYEAPPTTDPEAQENGTHDGATGNGEGEVVETEPTEITPLMHQHREVLADDVQESLARARRPAEEYGWWIAQMVLLVPATAILLFQLEVLLLNALMHTLVDGSSPATVYELLALLSVLIFLPLAPFAHKLPQALNVVVAAVALVLLAACWTAFPFTQEWPFRVYFQQSVELAPPMPAPALASNPALGLAPGPGVTTDVVRAETTLTGLQGYVDRLVAPEIPSTRAGSGVACNPCGLRPDLMTCTWATELVPSPGGGASGANASRAGWLDVSVARLNATRARVAVRGANTRGCRLYLDRAVNYVYVYPDDAAARPDSPSTSAAEPGHAPGEPPKMRLQGGYEMPAGGVKEVRLWSRTWGREFVVDVGWEGLARDGEGDGGGGLTGRAACEYAEYASGLAGERGGQIPALEEVKAFLPLWALPTKVADGLVEVWTRFGA